MEMVDAGFSREDLRRDTIIGARALEGLVQPPGFTLEQLRRDTYLVTEQSFPYMVSLERLLLEA